MHLQNNVNSEMEPGVFDDSVKTDQNFKVVTWSLSTHSISFILDIYAKFISLTNRRICTIFVSVSEVFGCRQITLQGYKKGKNCPPMYLN